MCEGVRWCVRGGVEVWWVACCNIKFLKGNRTTACRVSVWDITATYTEMGAQLLREFIASVPDPNNPRVDCFQYHTQ